ncbi:hypothetical protein HUT16_09630 [Kitasatospora sp. NA04385]|uniref:hypothetical protein n=1 Tax=Kitasatospora sp. NA04385 TaxID=2742135 RepID=UPI001592A48C|nr:hypothetical protein [Kitasatospora sp. NA04385]QKW19291.1 hypothetical protein HUT16_09630 [Kitasatospora sp. NA04385]
MVDFDTLARFDAGCLDRFLDAWTRVLAELTAVDQDFEAGVNVPLRSGEWTGKDADAARGHCGRVSVDLGAVGKEVAGLVEFAGKMAGGGEEGFRGLRALSDRARELRARAAELQTAIGPDGSVDSTDPRPADPHPDAAENARLNDRLREVSAIQAEAQQLLQEARKSDRWFADGLKVAFGTEDNFETEDRDFRGVGPDLGDRKTELTLKAAEEWLRHKNGYPDAADLLKHWLGASGTPYQVDPAKMLKDMPSTFGKDVDLTLDELRKHPDGPISTEWKSSEPDAAKDPRAANWYFGLNHFQYRLVGRKHGGTIDYQVEVRKRYDWGVPSEHRSNLHQTRFVNLEQADIAHLNTTGQARDFDVTGSTGPLTSPT